MWQPVTFEEKLIKRYYDNHEGKLYLEVKVGDSKNDESIMLKGLMLKSKEDSEVYLPEDYTSTRLYEEIEKNDVRILESCHTLNSDKIGKLLVEAEIINKLFSPSSTEKIILCSEKNDILTEICNNYQIKIILYDEDKFDSISKMRGRGREKFIDIRKSPDSSRRKAFLQGWRDAVKGDLYTGAYQYKTHANMGNLFGWIYGDTTDKFREETWRKYVENSQGEWKKN